MKLHTKNPEFFASISTYFSTVIRLFLNILLIFILFALLVGICKSGYDLVKALSRPLEELLQQMLLDVVFIVALVEISITILGYLKDGYVHVRYIVDTILIIMLNEVVSLWFKHPSIQEAGGIAILIGTLGLIRLSVVFTEQLSKNRD